MELWCIQNSNVPNDENEAYVVSHEFDDEEEMNFKFFVSSKRLLKLAVNSKKIHADGTYKLIWQGYPILVVGTTDMNRQFHYFGVCVSTHEREGDFQFIFKSLKEEVLLLYKEIISFEVMICDAAQAIGNAFHQVFGEDKIVVMCWAHMRRNVVKKIEKLIPKEIQKNIVQDIDTLQLAKSSKIFDKAVNLFFEKYKAEVNFLKYFKEEWLDQHRYWYEGVREKTPSTNNALESCNNVIKKESTLRERLPLATFKVILLEMVNSWSSQYMHKLKTFHETPQVDLKLWTTAYQWVKKNNKITSELLEDSVMYYIPAKDLEDVINVKPFNDWTEFSDYSNDGFSLWTCIVPNDKWDDGKCDCPDFFKKFICKHLVGMAIRLKLVKPPIEVKTVPLGEKRKRGRPAKAKKALLTQ